MKVPLIYELNELIETNALLRECLRPWDYQLQSCQQELKNVIHWTALPAITVAVNRRFEGHDQFGSYMAAIFALIFLADYIHCSVQEDEEGLRGNEGFQFSILLGDYLFGKAVGLLNQVNGHHLLRYFAQLMCVVNEGHVMRKLLEGKFDLEILAHEKASYYKFSFLTAAIAGGSNPLECRFYEETGFNLGMAIALYDEGLDKTGLNYLEKTRVLLSSKPGKDGQINTMHHLFDELMESLKPTREVVAI